MNNLQTLEFFRAGVQGLQVVHTCHDEDAGRLIILRVDGTVDTLSLNDWQVRVLKSEIDCGLAGGVDGTEKLVGVCIYKGCSGRASTGD